VHHTAELGSTLPYIESVKFLIQVFARHVLNDRGWSAACLAKSYLGPDLLDALFLLSADISFGLV